MNTTYSLLDRWQSPNSVSLAATLLPGQNAVNPDNSAFRPILFLAMPHSLVNRVKHYVEVKGRNGRFALYECNLGATTPRENVKAAIDAVNTTVLIKDSPNPNDERSHP